MLGAFLGAMACALLAFVWHLSTDTGSGQSLRRALCCSAVVQASTTASRSVHMGWPVTCPPLRVSSIPSVALWPHGSDTEAASLPDVAFRHPCQAHPQGAAGVPI